MRAKGTETFVSRQNVLQVSPSSTIVARTFSEEGQTGTDCISLGRVISRCASRALFSAFTPVRASLKTRRIGGRMAPVFHTA